MKNKLIYSAKKQIQIDLRHFRRFFGCYHKQVIRFETLNRLVHFRIA